MLRAGQVVAAVSIALLMLGVVMVSSAGMEMGRSPGTIQSILLGKHTLFMAGAVIGLMLTAWLFPAKHIANPPAWLAPDRSKARWGGWTVVAMWVVVIVTIAILASVYTPIGEVRKGSHRWIRLGVQDLTLQPSEFAKWIVVGLCAWYVVVIKDRLRGFFAGLIPALVAVAAISGFVAIEDLGTAVLIVAVASVMLVAGGGKVWQFVMLVPLAAGAIYTAVKLQPYRMARITAFLDPYADAERSGYHMIQSMVAISDGGLAGRGLGSGIQKLGYLPEDTTDFVFAIICEELGIAGAITVSVLYVVLLWAGLAIVRKQKVLQLKLIGLGVIATVGIQAVINLTVVTAVGPTKGIALPLISGGGTGWFLTAAALGVLVALDRYAVAEQAAVADDERRASAGLTAGSTEPASDEPASGGSHCDVAINPQQDTVQSTTDIVTAQPIDRPLAMG